MPAFRLMLGAPVAAMITLALFLLMAALVRSDFPAAPDDIPLTPPITFLRDIIETPLTREPRVFDDIPAAEAPPPPDTRADRMDQPVDPLTVPTFEGRTQNGAPALSMAGPTLAVPPAYPSRCQSIGVEGTVIVAFDVTPQGQVVNPRIVSSPHSCFDRPVLRAVQGWRYPPGMENGRPVARKNVRTQLSFTLTE